MFGKRGLAWARLPGQGPTRDASSVGLVFSALSQKRGGVADRLAGQIGGSFTRHVIQAAAKFQKGPSRSPHAAQGALLICQYNSRTGDFLPAEPLTSDD
jgi:hypothetical protein